MTNILIQAFKNKNMSKIKKELENVLEKYHLFGIIYADIDGKNIIKLGNLEALPEKSLIQTLFGGEIEIQNLHNTILGRQLPAGWGQGEVRCYIDITSNKKLFGVFGIVKKADVVENYHQSKIFCADVKAVIENN